MLLPYGMKVRVDFVQENEGFFRFGMLTFPIDLI